MSIATLLSQHHQVTAVDIVPEKVEMINNRKSPIQDDYIEKYLAEKELNLTATLDAKAAYSDADFVVIAAPGFQQRNANMSSERIMNLLVTIPAESRRMNVGKDVIRILGSPAYICILQRKDRQSIAITPCAAEHPMSFKVPDRLLTDGQCRMRINGVQFVQALLEANGLAAGKDYQFKGRYEAEKNAVIISLEKDEREC